MATAWFDLARQPFFMKPPEDMILHQLFTATFVAAVPPNVNVVADIRPRDRHRCPTRRRLGDESVKVGMTAGAACVLAMAVLE